jgi:hypothetical protein
MICHAVGDPLQAVVQEWVFYAHSAQDCKFDAMFVLLLENAI